MTFNWTDFIIYDTSSPTFFRYKTKMGPKTLQNAVAGRTRASKGVEVSITFTGSELATALYRSYGTQRISGARLAWMMHYGDIPAGHNVVCLDGDVQNLALDNLTLMTNSQRKLYKSLIEDASGVCKRGARGKWITRIRCKNGPDHHYSTHPTQEAATRAYRTALLKLLRDVL